MKNFGNKIDNDATSAGVVVASEYNSVFNELKGAVSPFLGLNEQDNRQLAKVMDISSKASFYSDVGSPNSVHLTRGATNEQLETLVNGMVVFFSPAHANTGASTLNLNGLGAKALRFKSSLLQAGALAVGVSYIAVYRLSDDSFHIDVVSNNKMPSELVDKVYVDGRFNALPKGGVLQVVSHLTAIQGSQTISTVDTRVNDLAKTIIPKGNNSKFLISVRWFGESNGGWNVSFNVRMNGARLNVNGGGRRHALTLPAIVYHVADNQSTPEVVNTQTLVNTTSIVGTPLEFEVVADANIPTALWNNRCFNDTLAYSERGTSEIIITEIGV